MNESDIEQLEQVIHANHQSGNANGNKVISVLDDDYWTPKDANVLTEALYNEFYSDKEYGSIKPEFIDFLSGVYDGFQNPKPCGRGYDDTVPINKVLALADTLRDEKKRNLEQELLDVLESNDSREDSCKKHFHARMIACYALCTRYRRNKDFDKFDALIKYTESDFRDEAIWKIQAAYSLSAGHNNDKKSLKKAYGLWKEISVNNDFEKIRRMPAFIQIYTEMIAMCLEKGVSLTGNEKKDRTIAENAIELLDIANEVREYPKFYSTKGRLEICIKKYEEAMDDLQRAISIENSSRGDYAIRISEYQIHIARCELMNLAQSQTEELKKYAEDVRNNKFEILSTTGFFTSVMALIMGGIDVSTAVKDVPEIYQLFICLVGCLIMAFGSLNLIMGHDKPYRINAGVTFLIGIILILVSIFGIPFLFKLV